MLRTDPRIVAMVGEAFDDLFKETGSRPKAPAVRTRLLAIGMITPIDRHALKGPCFFPQLFPLPGESWVRKQIQLLKTPKVAPEDYWTPQRSDNIDPAALGALVDVWKWAATGPVKEPFTNELAEWVAKLRFLPQAGGARTGEVSDPGALFRHACQFSAREKAARKAGDTDLRTDVVLAKLTLSETQYKVAARTKVINDEGIYLELELLDYYPSQGLQAHVSAELLAGRRPDLAPYMKMHDELMAAYPGEVREVWSLGLGLTARFPEWNELRDDDEHAGAGPTMAIAMFKDITESYDSGKPLTEYDPLVRIPLIIQWLRDQFKNGNPGTIKIGKIPPSGGTSPF